MFIGFRTGEPAAVAEVEDRVERIICYRGYGIPRAQRDELRQEVLVQLWRAVNGEGFDAARGFWGFVQTVAARRCIDWMRRRREAVLDEPSLVQDRRRDPLARVLGKERLEQANGVLDQLGAGCRDLIRMRVLEHMAYSEISVQLGRSEQALRAQMYRCVTKAKRILATSEEENHEAS